MKKIIFVLIAVLLISAATYAQPRPVSSSGTTTSRATAPESFEAKYEGGMFGYNEKEKGRLKFDDANKRLVFYGENQKENFSIPYAAVLVVYPQSRSVRSTTGTVASHIPLPGAGLFGLMREKRRYLILHFDDPDVDAKGILNFKLDNKALLDSVIRTLGQKANLTQRGDAYYRPEEMRTAIFS